MSFEPGTYRKGDRVRNVSTRRDAVQATWDGFVLAAPAEDASYADLQAQAKAKGVPANQSGEALRAALTDVPSEPVVDNPDAPETGSTSLVTGAEGSTGTDATDGEIGTLDASTIT